MGIKAGLNYADRDGQILQMRKAGASLDRIGQRFSISVAAVRAVLGKLQAHEKEIQRSDELLREIRLADDFDRKWRVEDLLDALYLSTRARTAIGNNEVSPVARGH